MNPTVLVCGKVFDGVWEGLTGTAEILIEGNQLARVGRSVNRSPGLQVIDLSHRTATPGFIDTHVHLTMDTANYYGSDWIKTTNTVGYFSACDDRARVTWFNDEMEGVDIDRAPVRHARDCAHRGRCANKSDKLKGGVLDV